MNYKELPGDTRVWIYQCDRKLSDHEIEAIKEQGDNFIDNWAAHGEKLEAAFEILHSQFLIIFADEEQAEAGGCSIDRSVHFIKNLEQEYSISLLNRTLIAYKVDEEIVTLPQEEFIGLVAQGTLSKNTIVFNNLVTTKQDLETKWEVPLKESWHKDLIER
ncbi:MAG: ABC transporter ATPase [candidate division Zixibacteria bacterium]